MEVLKLRWIIVLGVELLAASVFGQDTLKTKPSFFEGSKIYNGRRFMAASALGATTYAAFSVGLYNSWYKNYDQGSFHFFNDAGEWNQVDKAGHVFSAYFQSHFFYRGAKWAGTGENKSIYLGLLGGMLFQSTIEVMDGFSEGWGFSLTDMSANVAGLSCFYFQQKYWGEQRITLKESSWPVNYAQTPIISQSGNTFTTLDQRTNQLFGSSKMTRALKDYNVQTYWASINVHSFLGEDNHWPEWLNLAIGYGAGNLYGGFSNEWSSEAERYSYLPDKRYRQYYLALDYDLRKIIKKKAALNAILQVLNLYKWPAPAIEYNTLEGFKFHLLFRS